MSTSVISPRILKELKKINDPLLRIKRSIERFGRDLIDVAQKEIEQSEQLIGEATLKHIDFK
jgi:uncharacterized protein with ATP-grasp and redox domains